MATNMKPTLLRRLPPQLRTPVLYMDRAMMVLQKPPGLVSQEVKSPKASRLQGPSLTDALRVVSQDHSIHDPLFPVHRLDKGTTGALAIARTPTSAKDLSQQLSKRDASKTYLALVRGGAKTFPAQSGTIRQALTVEDGRVTLAAPHPSARRADVQQAHNEDTPWTDWEVVASSPVVPISLLRLKLHTGHKHQLRVHLASSLRAPILGDALHSKSILPPSITTHVHIPPDRLFLHASHLELWRYRKVAGTAKRFRLGVSAPLPRDFLDLCANLKIALDPAAPEIVGGVFVDGARATDQDLAAVDGYWLPRSRDSGRY